MILNRIKFVVAWICCLSLLTVTAQHRDSFARERIDLRGDWQLQLDTDAGIQERWQDRTFKETVTLPGSLEEQGKGVFVKDSTTDHLSQTWKYVGAAWYHKEIEIPEHWKDKQVRLFMERTKATQVWLNGEWMGECKVLLAPQVYRFEKPLTPGKHTLTIRVDNSPNLTPVGGSHALSVHTQTNWNGIIGELFLEAIPAIEIYQMKLTPKVADKRVEVKLNLKNNIHAKQQVRIELQAHTHNTPQKKHVKALSLPVQLHTDDSIVTIDYPLGKDALLWDEYNPALYKLSVRLLVDDAIYDEQTATLGLRNFDTRGTQFTNNGEIVFLRGKNDVCIFPLTGYPSMKTEDWRRLYRIAKSYGINHYRFHSYTPPQAAFEAADLEGIYIQTELPNWSQMTAKDTAAIAFQQQEGQAILDAYGNHPSLVMLSLGNELIGDREVHEALVHRLRKHDARPLYAFGTNAFYENPAPGETDDFWVTMRTGGETPNGKYDVRGGFATPEDAGNGQINTQQPSTRRNFTAGIAGHSLPIIGHENGQYQVYPDYREIDRYTGVLRPLNFEIFRKRLQETGMGDQASDFLNASGKLTALLYREEIEMALRTPGFAGFQLLDLQDFPGQGTALVGLLNAFMESKGLIDEAEFRQFNNDVVIQLLMDKYVWRSDETFTADIQLVNYSPQTIQDKALEWRIVDTETNNQIISGKLSIRANKGQISPIEHISFPLKNQKKASKFQVELRVPSTGLTSVYPIWVYPAHVTMDVPKNVHVATEYNDKVVDLLKAGERVILFPNHVAVAELSIKPQFISEFWNWKTFKNSAERMNRPVSAGTLGMLTDPEHPLFKHFPTEAHSNWQWWSIMKIARPLILDHTDKRYRPIVQIIDNIDRNHKLGMLFEFQVGAGKLFISMANLIPNLNQPEVRQLYYSMLQYVSSDDFAPQQSIQPQQLNQLLKKENPRP